MTVTPGEEFPFLSWVIFNKVFSQEKEGHNPVKKWKLASG